MVTNVWLKVRRCDEQIDATWLEDGSLRSQIMSSREAYLLADEATGTVSWHESPYIRAFLGWHPPSESIRKEKTMKFAQIAATVGDFSF